MVKLVIIFGSRVVGRARPGSDFDIAFLSDKPVSLVQKINLKAGISKKLKISEDKVDLIDLREASPLLQHQIAACGRLLSGNKRDFQNFQITAFKKYCNTAKLRRFREKMFREMYVR